MLLCVTSCHRWASPFIPFANGQLSFVSSYANGQTTNLCCTMSKGKWIKENRPGFRFRIYIHIYIHIYSYKFWLIISGNNKFWWSFVFFIVGLVQLFLIFSSIAMDFFCALSLILYSASALKCYFSAFIIVTLHFDVAMPTTAYFEKKIFFRP